MKAAKKNAQHSAATDEHGTPPELVALAQRVLVFIDLDPASSEEWNALVGAQRILTRETGGLRTPWFAGAPRPDELGTDKRECTSPTASYKTAVFEGAPSRGTVFLNPPGDKRGELVARFWCALAEYYRRGFVTSAVYVGFSVEQLARLQRVGAHSHPLEHTTLIPRSRLGYRDTPTTIGEDPTHASFVTLLSDDVRQIETFAAYGRELGHIVHCGRPRR